MATVSEERCGVAAFGHFLVSFLDESLQLDEEHDGVVVFLVPACVGSCVAYGSYGVGLDEECVLVAVVENLHDVEEVAAGLSLCPESVACAAIECHLACFYCLVVCLFVHESEHEHFECLGVLHDGRYETVHLVEIDFHYLLYNMCVLSC